MLEDYKFWLAIISVGLTLYAYIPYLKGIFEGKTKPHLFTWIIWSIVTFIAVFIQIVEGGGMGSWPIILATLICFLITGLSFKYGSKDIKPVDYVFLVASLSAIPLWVLTDNPEYAAVLVTTIQIVAAFPTIRKSWNYPEQEVMLTYGVNIVRYVLSIFALATFSVSTMVYPLGILLMNIVIFGVLLLRRNVTAQTLEVSSKL